MQEERERILISKAYKKKDFVKWNFLKKNKNKKKNQYKNIHLQYLPQSINLSFINNLFAVELPHLVCILSEPKRKVLKFFLMRKRGLLSRVRSWTMNSWKVTNHTQFKFLHYKF